MHAIHTTPGFIIGSRPYGDAGKILSIFTREFGLVYATAQGIRLEKSKLRYHIQDYSFGVYSLVRGREFWRMTSANATPSLHAGDRQSGNTESRELIARVALLLRRLLQGEQAHPELFDCIAHLDDFLKENDGLGEDEIGTLESVIVFRILHLLGYIGDDPMTTVVAKSDDITKGLLGQVSGKRTLLNQHINKALKESHL